MLNRGPDYDAATAALWSHREPSEFMGLVHYATLAANSHNAQAWRFRQTAEGVAIHPDMARPAGGRFRPPPPLRLTGLRGREPDAGGGRAAGRPSAIEFATDGDERVEIALGQAGNRDRLFNAILERQCTRSDYNSHPVPRADLSSMQVAARVSGCEVVLIEDRAKIEQILELILAASTAQVSDPAFSAELRCWLRFNARAAIETGDGLYSGCSGNPSLPTFLGRIMFGAFFKPDAENCRYMAAGILAPGDAIFIDMGTTTLMSAEACAVISRTVMPRHLPDLLFIVKRISTERSPSASARMTLVVRLIGREMPTIAKAMAPRPARQAIPSSVKVAMRALR
ncbi:hypothetical protein [Rhizobium sullae]|uniref:hypothetical protein n=1 Tax=Rhizobium sullae TaxID=50338 RepID=UPI0015C58922|nr:hypothetical protein [Rhizobium sullae]